MSEQAPWCSTAATSPSSRRPRRACAGNPACRGSRRCRSRPDCGTCRRALRLSTATMSRLAARVERPDQVGADETGRAGDDDVMVGASLALRGLGELLGMHHGGAELADHDAGRVVGHSAPPPAGPRPPPASRPASRSRCRPRRSRRTLPRHGGHVQHCSVPMNSVMPSSLRVTSSASSSSSRAQLLRARGEVGLALPASRRPRGIRRGSA